jgi:hypothetical protein
MSITFVRTINVKRGRKFKKKACVLVLMVIARKQSRARCDASVLQEKYRAGMVVPMRQGPSRISVPKREALSTYEC